MAHRGTTRTNFRHLAAQSLAAQHTFSQHACHVCGPDGKKETIDTVIQGAKRDLWVRSLSDEWGRLAQGNDYGTQATDTIKFIHKFEVPDGRDVTCATHVLDYRPLKSEPYRIRITVGGDRLTYPGDSGSPAANLVETKLLLNSTISDANNGARFMSADIEDFFLATPMDGPECTHVQCKHTPEDIKKRCNLATKVTTDGYIHMKIKKGMHRLKQAALLAHNHLQNNPRPFGYTPVIGTIGLSEHKTRQTKFCLCVDDFGIKYFNKKDADHLLNAIGTNYKYAVDWERKHYCGLTMEWNYKEGCVDVSMPSCIPDASRRLGHAPTTHPQHSPHEHIPTKCGTKGTQQCATAPDMSPFLTPKETKFAQSVTGSFLHYGRALDATFPPALNEIAAAQSQPTQKTKQKAQRLMDYMHAHPSAYMRHYASGMVLHMDSDAAYLIAPKARSRVAGYFHLSDHPNITKHPKRNGAILVECKIL